MAGKYYTGKRLYDLNRKAMAGIGILIAFVCALLLAVQVNADSELTIGEVNFNALSGVENGYSVSSEAQVLALRNGTETETSGRTFVLENDIAVSSRITKAATGTFAGTLDGDGHKISYTGTISITSVYHRSVPPTVTDPEVNEGLLFGTVTGTIRNLFVDVKSAAPSYQFSDPDGATATNKGGISQTVYETAPDPDSESDKTKISDILNSDVFVRNSGSELTIVNGTDNLSVVTSTDGKTDGKLPKLSDVAAIQRLMGDGNSVDYYYKCIKGGISVVTDTIYSRNGKKSCKANFGVICGKSSGKIENIQVEGNDIAVTGASTRTISKDVYAIKEGTGTKTYYYKSTITYEPVYGKRNVVEKYDEYPVYKCLYATEDGNTYDITTPLYYTDKGVFATDKPRYAKTEDGNKYNLNQPVDENGSYLTATGTTEKPVLITMDYTKSVYRCLYATYKSPTGKYVVDTDTPLYNYKNASKKEFDYTRPKYQVTDKYKFDLKMPLDNTGGVTTTDGSLTSLMYTNEAIQSDDKKVDYTDAAAITNATADTVSRDMYLYKQKSGGTGTEDKFDLDQPLYRTDADGKFNFEKPIYETLNEDGKVYFVLERDSEDIVKSKMEQTVHTTDTILPQTDKSVITAYTESKPVTLVKEKLEVKVNPEAAYESEYTRYIPSISAGILAGTMEGGSVDGAIIDGIGISAEIKDKESTLETVDKYEASGVSLGGVAGTISSATATIKNVKINCNPGTIKLPTYSYTPRTTESRGILVGTANAGVEIDRCILDYDNSETSINEVGSTESGVSVQKNNVLSQNDTTSDNWISYVKEKVSAWDSWTVLTDTNIGSNLGIAKSDTVYLPNWWVQPAAVSFDSLINQNIDEKKVSLTVQSLARTNEALGGKTTDADLTATEMKQGCNYTYRPIIDNTEQKNTVTASGKIFTIQLGNSGYFILNDYLAYDGRFYYLKEFDTGIRFQPFISETDILPNYEAGFYRDEEEVKDYINVTGKFNPGEDIPVKFYSTTDKNSFPVYSEAYKDSPGSSVGEGMVQAVVTEAKKVKKADGTWENDWLARVEFAEKSAILKGFWTIGDKIYQVKSSDEQSYDSEDREQIKAINELSYFKNYSEEKEWNYTDVTYNLNQQIDPVNVYVGQNIRITEYAVKSPINECVYKYLIAVENYDITDSDVMRKAENHAEIYTEEKIPLKNSYRSNMYIPARMQGVESAYLYVFKSKENFKSGVIKVPLSISAQANLTYSIPSGSSIVNGTILKVQTAQVKQEQEMEGIRYLVSQQRYDTSSSINLDENNDGVVPSNEDEVVILLQADHSPKIFYVYLQPYNKAKQTYGETVELKYQVMNATSTPVASPNTISVENADSSVAAAYSAENNDIVTLAAEENSTILYRAGNSYADSVVKVKVVSQAEQAEQGLTTATENIIQAENTVYVHCNGIWYKADSCKVYDETTGIPMQNNTKAAIVYYLGAVSICENREVSDVAQYAYNVKPIETTEPVTAVIATSETNPTQVQKDSYLLFQTATPDAQIYYNINSNAQVETTETESTSKYDEKTGIQVTGEYGSLIRISLIAVKKDSAGNPLMNPSVKVTYIYKVTDQNSALPPASVPVTTDSAPAVVAPGEKILLSTNTAGASIYYTTNGSDPAVTLSSKAEDATVTVVNGELYDAGKGIVMPDSTEEYFVLRAVTVKPGLAVSTMVQMTFAYPGAVLPPYASIESGKVTAGTSVELKNTTEGAVIYYEIAYDKDTAGTPTVSSAVYDEAQAISITKKTSIKAIAVKDGMKSRVVSYTYTVSEQTGAVKASIPVGSVVSRSTKLILSADSDAKIYYTTDGSDPSDSANAGVIEGSELVLDGDYGALITIKAYAKKSGKSSSDVHTFTYQISRYQGGVTSDTPSGTELAAGTQIHLLSDIAEADIYFTTDGTAPVKTSEKGTAVTISGAAGTIVTVKAMAVPKDTSADSGGSAVSIFTYKIREGMEIPSASPAGGELLNAIDVTLQAAKGSIYYTIDGSIPTSESTMYTEPVHVTRAMTIKAVAYGEDGSRSSVAAFQYTVAAKAAAPISDTPDGAVDPGTVITLRTATDQAAIYYSMDGTAPERSNLSSCMVYGTEGIVVNRSVVISAVTYKDGMLLSEVSDFSYEVAVVPAAQDKEEAEQEALKNAVKETDSSGLADKREKDDYTGTTYQEVVLKDKDSKTLVSSKEETLPKAVRLVTTVQRTKEEAELNLKALLGDEYCIIKTYDMKLYEGDQQVQPSAEVEIGIPIPEEQADAAIVIVGIGNNNQITTYDTRRDGTMAYAKTDHFSLYALAGVFVQKETKMDIDLIQMAECAAAAVAGFGILFILFRKTTRKSEVKRKKN